MEYKIINNHVELDKIGKVKKITGTRLGTILGLNPWSTPFEAWCDMTKLYKEPFEETIYTEAGKIIEPKIIKYLNEVYTGRVIGPEDYFGKDYPKMRYDFWPNEPIFGGMWDALVLNKNTGKPRAVIEIKTTKRAEDWQHDVPLYYKLQAMLYAKLLGLKHFIFAVAFLDDSIYEDPNKFEANEETVKVMVFDLDDYLITEYMTNALTWYHNYIRGKTSPDFDEKKDADILKELRTNRIEATETIDDYLATLDEVRPIIEANEVAMREYTDKLKKAEDGLKKELESQFKDQDKTVAISSKRYEFRLNRTVKTEDVFDMDQFKRDHPELYDQYLRVESKETIRKQIKILEAKNE